MYRRSLCRCQAAGEPWPGNYKYTEGAKKGQPVEPCGDGCPDLERGDCRPSGDLYFILEKFPRLGAVCRLHTSSYRSIRNLSNGLMQIRKLNGGRLAGVKAVLKATPEKIWYRDRSGINHTSVVHPQPRSWRAGSPQFAREHGGANEIVSASPLRWV